MRYLITILILLIPVVAVGQTKVSSMDGYEFQKPAGWKHVDQGQRYLLGSDTEAGLIAVWFHAGATMATLEQGARQPYTEEGIRLMPAGEPKKFKAGGLPAVSVALTGQAQDGSKLKGKATSILGKGGAVGVLALTSPEKFAALEPRMDAIVKSIKFVKSTAPAGANQLHGTLCNYYGNSNIGASSNFNYSRTRKVSFDGRGRAAYGAVSTFSYDDDIGSSTGISGDGDPTSQGTYSVRGDVVTVKFPEANYTCKVIERLGGTISGVKCGEDLWAKSLCD